MVKNDKIREYLINNPEKLNSDYTATAKLFDTTYETIRGIARVLRKSFEGAFEAGLHSASNNEKITTNEQKDSLVILANDDNIYENYMVEKFYYFYKVAPENAYSFYVHPLGNFGVGQGADGFAINTNHLDGIKNFYNEDELKLIWQELIKYQS